MNTHSRHHDREEGLSCGRYLIDQVLEYAHERWGEHRPYGHDRNDDDTREHRVFEGADAAFITRQGFDELQHK
jgi:hypothetical protein